jgi:mono/diheme cytochrome c family protein
MLSWKDIPDGELIAIVSYLKTFSSSWKSGKPGTPVSVSPDPWEGARHADAVARGRILYHGLARCQSCHPAYEKPETLQAEIQAATGRPWMPRDDAGFGVLKESDFGTKLMPPDFRTEPLRSVRKGQERADLFRVIAAGVGGTAMPTWKGILPDADIWALAHYVDSLRRHGETGKANAD